MIGSTRFAAIFFTLASSVAGGGGAAYYWRDDLGITNQGVARSASEADDAGSSRREASDSEHPADGPDLTAVENAWAEAAAAESTAPADLRSVSVPRSAEETLASSDAAIDLASHDDRYGTAPVPSASAETGSMAAALAATEIAEVAVDAASSEASAGTSLTADSPAAAATPAHLHPESSGAIARGQEPGAEPAILPIEESELALSEGDSIPIAPQSLSARPGAARARDAFQEAPETIDSRYDSAGPAPGGNTLDAVNPFAGGPTPAPIAPESRELEAIEPLPNEAALPTSGAYSPAPTFDRQATRAMVGSDFAAPPSLNSPPPSPSDVGMNPRTLSTPSGEGTGRPGERSLEGPQSAAVVIHKIAPPEIQVGKKATFQIKVQNVGSQTAEEVVLRDEVPKSTQLAATSPTAEVAGTELVWQIGKLSPGEEQIVEIELLPTAEGEVGSVASVSYSAQASVKTRCTMPQLAIRMTAPPEVMIGHEQRVKIELHNPGTGDAHNVMLFETVPENVRHAAGPVLEFEIGTLKAGQTRELELILLAEKAGPVVNVLSARADGNLQIEQQVEFEVIAPAISVAVAGPGRRYLERPATYQVVVENPGTAPARDVELVTKLPKGLKFVKANNMGEYDPRTHAVYWSLAELPEGEIGKVELTALPIEPGVQTLSVEGRAQQGLADQTTQQIEVEGIASIMFEVRDEDDPIEVGGETAYDIRIVNEGTKGATNVQVVVHLTPGLEVVAAEGETRHAIQGATLLFEPLAQLAPKADTKYRVRVRGAQPGDQRINVEVKTDDLAHPIRREESTRVFGDD